MQKQNFSLKGMSCAACAARIEKAVRAVPGVADVNVMLLKNAMTVLCADDAAALGPEIEDAVRAVGYEASSVSASVMRGGDASTGAALKRAFVRLVLSVVLAVFVMVYSMLPDLGLSQGFGPEGAALLTCTAALAVMVLQRRCFISAARALKHLNANMDTLVSLGSAASFLYSLWNMYLLFKGGMPMDCPLYFDSACGILAFVAVGKHLESRVKAHTTDAVSRLCALVPRMVKVQSGDEVRLVPYDEVNPGDLVLLKAGDQVGVDGTVLEGEGHADESTLTGESVPVKKVPSTKVVSASHILDGSLKVKAECTGADTTLSRIIAMVDEASGAKAPVARLADRIAAVFVPAVLAVAAVTFVCWYGLIHFPLADALSFAVSVLVVSCPCALGLATPAAVMAGTGRAAEAGILFKSPAVMENLSRADLFAFDKTGTLTYGKLTLRQVFSKTPGLERLHILMAASVEQGSSHPLAQALLASAQGSTLFPCTQFKEHQSCGVEALIAGTRYAVGNERCAKLMGAVIATEDQAFLQERRRVGASMLILYKENAVEAFFELGDELKGDAAAVMLKLKELGLKTLMLTGDHEAAARATACRLGLDSYRAGLLPWDKSKCIEELQQQGHKVVMVGDGVNDSISLVKADIGMGIAGTSDIAVSACGVVLLRGQLGDCTAAYSLSRAIMLNIRENLFWAFIYNLVCIPLAAGIFYETAGLKLSPMLAALLMSMSSVCVVLNALRLGRQKIEKIAAPNPKKEVNIMKKQISVEGMHCSHCESAVKKNLEALPGVKVLSVSAAEKTAMAEVPEVIDDSMLKAAVESAGFKFVKVQ